MPITVITGQPGNGKTLLMMERLEAALKEAKRPVYVHGVKGSLPDQARPLDDAKDWQSVEDGALIFVDEAWKSFGHLQDARQAKTPDHVLALAEHRHRGIDFVMTTQMANQLFPFMRGLIGEHTHVVRQFGTSMCTLYTWGELNEDVKSQGQRDKALPSTWLQPARLFPQYHSATMHTIKRKIPWRLALIPICLIAGVVLAVQVYAHMKKGDDSHASKDATGVAGASEGMESGHAQLLTAEQWSRRLVPRIAGLHGSQPIFDGRKVRAEPATYCVIVGDGSGSEMDVCRCYTEQVTPIPDVNPGVCREAARFGIYDPFRAPLPTKVLPGGTARKPAAKAAA